MTIRLVVIATDFAAAANVGGNPETTARTFDLPADIAEYIASHRGKWQTVQLAIDDSAIEKES